MEVNVLPMFAMNVRGKSARYFSMIEEIDLWDICGLFVTRNQLMRMTVVGSRVNGCVIVSSVHGGSSAGRAPSASQRAEKTFASVLYINVNSCRQEDTSMLTAEDDGKNLR